MTRPTRPVAIVASEAPPRAKVSIYPEPFAEGHPTLHTDEGRMRLSPGMCAGFEAGTGNGHRLINETDEEVVYLEVGDRTPGDEGTYPDDDLRAIMVDGGWQFVHKDGTPY